MAALNNKAKKFSPILFNFVLFGFIDFNFVQIHRISSIAQIQEQTWKLIKENLILNLSSWKFTQSLKQTQDPFFNLLSQTRPLRHRWSPYYDKNLPILLVSLYVDHDRQAWSNIEKANKSEMRLLCSSTACPIFNELVT